MKINGINRVGGTNPYARQDTKSTELKGKQGSRKDEVQISPEAKELLEARRAAYVESRSQKVQELKQSVSTGTYRVDSGQIAEKLLPYIK